MAQPAYINKLPPEVMIMIFDSLSKLHLKNARPVSKQWESFAVHYLPYLYDTVVISPNQANFDTFLEVAYHPNYSVHAKHLVYDGTWFDERMDLVSEVLAEGLAAYQQYAREQEILSTNDELISVLKISLRKFSSLRTVIIEDGWARDWSPSEEADGPGRLCRDWNPLRLRPWNEEADSLHPWISVHFRLLLDVLTTTKRHVQDWDWRHRQSVGLTQYSSPIELLKTDFAVAFQCLRRLNLSIDCERPLLGEGIAALSRLLQAANALEEVRLISGAPDFHLPFPLFVCSHTWSHLRVLHIDDFQTSQTQLLAYLQRHAGTLREICFYRIRLTEGLWAGVFDYMRDYLNLGICKMNLLSGGEAESVSHETMIGEYIVNGGQNPWRHSSRVTQGDRPS